MNQPVNIICPLCGERVEKLIYRYHLGSEKVVLDRIREQYPGWVERDGACGRCIDYYQTEIVLRQRVLPEIGPFFPVKSADDYIILPTPLRLDTDARFTGKGVTICFIDSGFCPHPDLTSYRNRVKFMADFSDSSTAAAPVTDPAASAWHGTMTAVVCAGDGFLSNGLYKGIAPDAELVLLRTMNNMGHIPAANIEAALQWVISNHKEYGIRIVNMSLGDDRVQSHLESRIDQLAEQLVREGVLVVAAVGNDESGIIKAPASSPAVIAVGGVDDGNRLDAITRPYHSSYGSTPDGFFKPELVAHAIWIAAPLLPESPEQKEAELLYKLCSLPEAELPEQLSRCIVQTKLDLSVLQYPDPATIKNRITERISACKFISPFYMHVDGTSFAAPVVSAVAAQLLELNPDLSPSQLRSLLFSTARRLEGFPAERQGFGVVQPRKAVLQTLNKRTRMKQPLSPFINHDNKTIAFYVHNEQATQIALAGTFNHWAQDVLLLEPGQDGIWKIEIPLLPEGKYQYKFLVDERTWIEDYDNPLHEPDGFRGFNSILLIENAEN